ncbi:MAG: exonuclease domain-containing protein [Thermoflexales bacterium]|nr:exonuclease domain-containing protein [Thermoflexales bacterium]
MRTLVSLDIETTGTDPERDAILEIGIVHFRGEEVLEEWRCIVDPNRPIPPKITELTGITDDLVAREGRPLGEALRQAERIIGNTTIIGHNIAFDLGFFQKLKYPPAFAKNPTLDTFELSSILVPHAGRYSLGALAAELGIPLENTHRALDDARTAHRLYLRLFERALDLPQTVLDEILAMSNLSNWALADFWRDVSEAQARGTFSTTIGAALRKQITPNRTAQTLLQRKLRRERLQAPPLEPHEKITPLDVDELAGLLAEGGLFAQKFPGYEPRESQIAMLREVAQTFNQGGVKVIEAGTGTGKSLAYLLPAVRWAMQNGARVVVSTATINLQEQLAEKDVPSVSTVLGEDIRVAVMKGRGRYLCPNRLAELRKAGPRTSDEARVLAKILIWLPHTTTGDGDELFLPTPAERQVFQSLSAQNPVCTMNTCSATECFFYQARRLAESAHVVIINHALLLADISVENRALPEHDYLVIDEAHHLEAAATDSLTWRFDREELQRQINDLGRDSQSRKHAGLLYELADKARKSAHPEWGAAVERLCDQALAAAAAVWQHNSAAFNALLRFVEEHGTQDSNEYAQTLRLTPAVHRQPAWGKVEAEFEALIREMDGLARAVHSLLRALDGAYDSDKVLIGFDAVATRLSGAHRFLEESSERLRRVFLEPDEAQIDWVAVEQPRSKNAPARVTVNAAPLHVGPMLAHNLWLKKRAVVLTSATLRTATGGNAKPSFDYMLGRLQAEDAETLALPSPFDYKNSALLYIVTDVPEPNQPGYQQALERGLVDLFRASQGRGLALFTSYSSLRASARAIAPELLREGIIVLEQGNGTSRRAMVESFRAAERAVMLGTRSFWEGVDIQGEQLSVVAICKLPFDVPNDPIVAARSETFSNPFSEYSVPEAVLRLCQGFGRLIRSKRDRGVVVVFDSRLVSKSYGAAFLNALPGPSVQRGPLSRLPNAVREWLSRANGTL